MSTVFVHVKRQTKDVANEQPVLCLELLRVNRNTCRSEKENSLYDHLNRVYKHRRLYAGDHGTGRMGL